MRWWVQRLTLAVRWSKTIQYRQRVLLVPLPRIPLSPLCPSFALLSALRLCSAPADAPPFTFSSSRGWAPLAAHMFTVRLHALLSTLGASPASYSGHSFRRGGASFALECGLPTELIKAQGDWVSNAYELYASPSLPMRKDLAATLGKRISTFLG